MMHVRTILVLAPHTDDGELGCGGTIARYAEAGCDVHVAAFSTCAESLVGYAPDALEKEFRASLREIGASPIVYRYPVRRLSEHRQAILEDMVKLRDAVKPDLVLMPSPHDCHQDHEVVSAEGLRAFKGHASIWCFELPWNHITFDAEAFVALTPDHMERKWRALSRYETQVKLGRPYFDRRFIEGQARMRGVQIGAEFAESFEVLRLRLAT
jgi:LmbE family N-acetylglucosaminyl deacetylase